MITGSRGDGTWGAIARYLAAAVLARGADAGAVVGLVLLAAPRPHGAAIGGVLTAALTAPHLLGPLVAKRLDRARDGRRVLAASFAGYGAAIAVSALVPLALAVVAVVAAGACGPLLTGGLSSRLAGITRKGAGGGGRAEGLDAVTYGVAGTAGPALVALLASATTPRTALLALAAAAVVAAGLVLGLPGQQGRPADRGGGALRLLAASGPLRRVGVATMLTAFSTGGLSLLAVVLGRELSRDPAAGATLAAMFGAGNLAGSVLVTAFPLRGEPDRLTTRHVVSLGAALALAAAAPSAPLALGAFALAGAANAPFFAATLAARARYAPPAARAQVFVSMAGLKVAMASAGAALTGAAIALGPRSVLAAGAAIVFLAAAATALDRRLSGPSAA
jgi:MFS family permease